MKQKRCLTALLAASLLLSICGCGPSGQARQEGTRLTVYLYSSELLQEYAPLLQEMVPEAGLEFVVGRSSTDFYLQRQAHGELPDIIVVSGGLSPRDSLPLDPYLMDLSATETAAAFYDTYLENYRDDSGAVRWLPAGGVANGILANVDLFERYSIPLPTDYDSFAAACRAFLDQGIQPYTTDYKYPYTCLYTLEGWSIPSLMSRQGTQWRHDFERGHTDALEETLWTGVLEHFAAVVQDTGMGPAEIDRGFTMTMEDFRDGKVPMVRGMVSELTTYSQYFDCVLLPYFGQGEGGNWLLTVPRFQVALSAALDDDGNERKKELALKVLDVMFSSQGYEALTSGVYIHMLPYNRGVEVPLPASLQGLQSVIDSNHLYIHMNSASLQNAVVEAVHGILSGELDAHSAYGRMSAALTAPTEDQEIVATLEDDRPVSFQPDTGNQAASSIANTLRKIAGSDLLLAPASICTGSLYAGDYTDQRLDETMPSGGNRLYTARLTGAEVRELVRLAVEGYGLSNDPFSDQTLPIASGFTMEVEKLDGSYRLSGILVDGAPLADGETYTFTIADLPSLCQPLMEQALGEGASERFTASERFARLLWTDHIKQGEQPVPPTPYITLKESK